ncbi:phosphomevalonate kinase [Virgibacillus byunsanensis]|uniref:phosphomevalonate kinase n=1 Tax=Virgibacillus byunsanensis TaxID=570945 RepID=A0ABW3LH75_9BACI
MPNPPLTIKVPGKLMIAGEFAVLEPHHDLVVMAVDRYVYATLKRNNENRLTLHNFKLYDLKWEFEDQVNITSTDNRLRFVEDAMTICLTYLQEKGITCNPFDLSIKSELDDASGLKYGLGSSAAVVTSAVSVILEEFLPDSPTKELIFKLASIAHVKTQGSGSGADVAASSYGGLLRYSSFQAEWLKEQHEKTVSILELVNSEWTYFSIEPITFPDTIQMCIGWTGKPASTSSLIGEIKKLKVDNNKSYQEFLHNSQQAVSTFLKGIKDEDSSFILDGVRQNRQALSTVGKQAKAAIETPLLGDLCDLAEQIDGAGKPSGAGGGDCGIAFVSTSERAQKLKSLWENAGIKPLDIRLARDGACVHN